jgi:hypothetical protein
MSREEHPRRAGKVILLVVGLWVAGNALQSLIGWLLSNSSLVDANAAVLVGQVLAWGLLFVVSYYYRHELDVWLRS